MQYGVPAERIAFTGFPLPPENVASAAEDLHRRIPVLDAQGAFRHGYGHMIDAELGPAPAADARPLSVTYAVGGAGAQVELARDILRGLSGALHEGRMRLNLVAGVRPEVEQYFRRAIGELGLEAELGRGIHLLLAPTKDEYFSQFNRAAARDRRPLDEAQRAVLLSGPGIPLVMSAPLGAHEEHNLETVLRSRRRPAAGGTAPRRRVADRLGEQRPAGAERLPGLFPHAAMGTENIKRLIFAPDRSQVAMDLGAVLPERI